MADPSRFRRVAERFARPVTRKTVGYLRHLAYVEPPTAPRAQGHVFNRSDFANEGVAPDGFPIPPRDLWRSMASTFEQFTAAGEDYYVAARAALADAGFVASAASRVLDFGSGSGRFVRRWPLDEGEVWGCDVNVDQIQWCQAYLSPPFHFVTNGFTPPLPFDDRSFDVIHAGSVFTHIPERYDAWLLEMRRVLRPGALLYATIHDEHTWELMQAGQAPALDAWVDLHPAGRSPSMPGDLVVLGEGPSSNVFFRTDFFVSLTAPNFEVVAIIPEARGYQTAVILRRPA